MNSISCSSRAIQCCRYTTVALRLSIQQSYGWHSFQIGLVAKFTENLQWIASLFHVFDFDLVRKHKQGRIAFPFDENQPPAEIFNFVNDPSVAIDFNGGFMSADGDLCPAKHSASAFVQHDPCLLVLLKRQNSRVNQTAETPR